MRILRVITLLALGALTASPAHAQSFQFYPYDEENSESLDSIDFAKWANMSRCLCDAYAESQAAGTATLNVRVRDSSGSYTTQEVYFYLGDDCDSEATAISDVCREITVINHSDFNQEQTIPIPINWVVDPMGGECTEQNGGTTTLYVIMDDPNNAPSATYVITYDTAPPGPPSDVSASGGEGAVTVSWDPPETDDENIEYYNVLCALDGAPLESPTATAAWMTTQDVCGQDLTPDTIPDPDAGVADAGVDAAVSDDASPTPDASGVDAAVQNDAAAADGSTSAVDCNSVSGGFSAGDTYPNPCFVCGRVGYTGTSMRITGLENNRVYDFAVVAIDEKGNVSEVSTVASATPVLTTDFAEHYSGAGGAEEGGFCYIATAVYGDYDHADVRQLRAYRDSVLARSHAGQRFVRWYYAHGPKLVRLQRRVPPLSVVSRLGLEGLVWISRQLTPGSGGADPHRAALPLGVLLLGVVLSLARLAGRREDDDEQDDDPEVTL